MRLCAKGLVAFTGGPVVKYELSLNDNVTIHLFNIEYLIKYLTIYLYNMLFLEISYENIQEHFNEMKRVSPNISRSLVRIQA